MKRNIPPINALIFAEAVFRLGSFKLAAEEQLVTASAVSHQIKALEGWLGFALFIRKSRQSEPTEAGKRYLQNIGSLLSELETLTFSETNCESDVFVIRLHTTDSFANRWLVGRLTQYLECNDNIQISVQTIEYNQEFQSGYADVGIMFGERHGTNITSRLFLPEQIYPVCHPKFIDTNDGPENLLREVPLIDDCNLGVEWSQWFAVASDELVNFDETGITKGATYNHSHLALKAAELGDGIALASHPLVMDALKAKTLVAPFQTCLDTSEGYYIVQPKGDYQHSSISQFIEWLLDQAEQGALSKRD